MSKNNQPLVSIHSSSRGQSKIFFYEDHFIFQLENDHTPRTFYFNEIDTIILKKASMDVENLVSFYNDFYGCISLFVY